MNIAVMMIFGGVLLTLVTLGLALGGGSSASQSHLRKRAQALHQRHKGGGRGPAAVQASSLRRDHGRSVPLIEEFAKRFLPRQTALRDRLARTGKEITVGTYVLINLGLGIAVSGGAMLGVGLPAILALLLGLIVGSGLPHVAIGYMGGRRRKKFLAILPDAIDLIVRGLRSGLPVTESIATVGREMADPVGTEFRRIADGVRFGRQLEDAVWETAKRLAVPEFNFFVISLSIQRETGGNLGESLANLSDTLRRRQTMRLKIRAMSSEARASAYILGSLPFLMFGIVHLINPGYTGQLFTDPRGLIMVGIGLLSIAIGIAVMIKMVRFEI